MYKTNHLKTMKTPFPLIFSHLFFPALTAQNDQSLKVKKIMKNLADCQIANHNNLEFCAEKKDSILENITRLIGLMEHFIWESKWAAIANRDKYCEGLKGIGEAHDWKLHMREEITLGFITLMILLRVKPIFIFNVNVRMRK